MFSLLDRPNSPARRAALALGACLALTPLSACSGADSDPLETIPAFALDTPAVEVTEAGERPQLLEYTDTSAGEDAAAWETTVEVSTGLDQDVLPADHVDEHSQAPAGGNVDTVTLPLQVASSPAAEPGEGESPAAREVEFTVGTATHSDLDRNEELASAEDFLMRWRAAETGAISTLKLLAPGDSTEAGRETVERSLLLLASANVVLPKEPVGVGGSWTVRNRITGASNMLRTSTYTVTAIDGDRVELDVDVEERPTQQSLSIDNEVAGELNGSSLDVETTSTTSQGSITLDLTRPLPVAGQVASTTRLVYSGAGGTSSSFKVVQDVTEALTYGADA